MEKTSPAKVPVFIWVVIIALLAGLYGYAAYWDPARPENTVRNYYQAYLAGDYDKVANNLSVFWALRLLPQYMDMDAPELLANRAEIEKELSQVIKEMESMYGDTHNDVTIEILKPYTKEGSASAVVVYKFKEDSQAAGMGAAILIKEQGRFRIFTMTPIDDSSLSQVDAVNIKAMDENFIELISAPE